MSSCPWPTFRYFTSCYSYSYNKLSICGFIRAFVYLSYQAHNKIEKKWRKMRSRLSSPVSLTNYTRSHSFYLSLSTSFYLCHHIFLPLFLHLSPHPRSRSLFLSSLFFFCLLLYHNEIHRWLIMNRKILSPSPIPIFKLYRK